MSPNLYRLWWGDSNDRREIGRVLAETIDQVIDLVKTEYLKPNTEFEEEGDEENLYLILDICKTCDIKNEGGNPEDCIFCEGNEYFQIELNNDVNPSFKLITGENFFFDLVEVET